MVNEIIIVISEWVSEYMVKQYLKISLSVDFNNNEGMVVFNGFCVGIKV